MKKLLFLFIVIFLLSACTPSPGANDGADDKPPSVSDTQPPSAVTQAPTSIPEPTPLGGGNATVFFLSDRDNAAGHFDIYALDLATLAVTRITDSPIDKLSLVVSPDGYWGAFVTGEYEQHQIYTVDLTQPLSEPVLVTPKMVNAAQPVWSPNSDSLAFTHTFSIGKAQVYTMNPDGSNLQAISNEWDRNLAPVWSLDGAQISYTKMPLSGAYLDYPEIYQANADGRQRTGIGDVDEVMELGSFITSDGKGTVFIGVAKTRYFAGLFYVQGEDKPILLADGEAYDWPYSLEGSHIVYPAYSPDGTKIALSFFSSYSVGWQGSIPEIYLLEADGSSFNQIYQSENAPPITPPSWTPDGTAIVIEEEGQIYLLNVTTLEKIPLTDSGTNLSPMLVIHSPLVTQEIIGIQPTTTAPDLDLAGTGKLAYVSDQEGSNDIYVYDLDAGETSRLTWDFNLEQHLAWSPDGGQLAFTSSYEGLNTIYLAPHPPATTLSSLTPLTPSLENTFSPSWSPNGGRLAFVSQPKPDSYATQIQVIDTAGGRPELMSFDFGIHSFPQWSPSGEQLAFTHNDTKMVYGAPYIDSPKAVSLNLAGKKINPLGADDGQPRQGPIWSPDGDRLFYIVVENFTREATIMSMDIQTGEETILAEGLPSPSEYATENFWLGSWSPDGDKLAFLLFEWEIDLDYSYGGTLFLVDFSGASNAVRLADIRYTDDFGPPVQAPTWSPDGSLIAFTKTNSGNKTLGIYTIRPDGSDLTLVSDPSFNCFAPAWVR
jgi:Tol biopolymer transport system component